MSTCCAALGQAATGPAAQQPPPIAAQTTTAPPLNDAALKDMLVQTMLADRQPAIVAAVFDDSSITARAVVGVRVLHEPAAATIDDVWHLGSISKSITSTMIGALVEEGALKWDATLPELFPADAAAINERYAPVKLSMVLRHRAGVPAFTDGGSPDFAIFDALVGGEIAQRAAFASKLLARGPVLDPGSRFMYSNAGYALAAAGAERATGRAWSELVRTRVFEPLKLSSAGFGWPASPQTPHEPRGHRMALAAAPEPLDPVYKLPLVLQPAGDVKMSIADLATYAQTHLRGLRGKPGLLKPETIQELHRDTEKYACGWEVFDDHGHTVHRHNGSAGTFYALMTIIPDRNIGVVVVVNSGGGAKACDAVTKGVLESK